MKTTKKIIISIFALLCSALLFANGTKDASTNNLQGQSASTNMRIVSLGASSTEIIYAIGAEDYLVARTDFCDYPAQAKNLPSVGGFDGKALSLEAILSFEPTLVYAFSGMHDHLVKPLTDLGVQVFVSNATSIDAIKDEILASGNLTGKQKQAKAVVATMDKKLDQVASLAKKTQEKLGKKPTVFWEIWSSPLMSVGKNSFINDIISKAGAVNIFADEPSPYPIVSEEAVMLAEPDFIFYTSSDATDAITKEEKMMHANWTMPAFGLYNIGTGDKFSRPSPRCVDAVAELADLMYKALQE